MYTTKMVMALAGTLLFSAGAGRATGQSHTYPQIESELLAAETNYPSLCKRYFLGTTVGGRSMWALRLSDNVETEEDEPEFRYISTMHGDEITGVELCFYLIDHLTTNYGSDPRLTNIVDSIEIWIVPCMNPDGYVAGVRGNGHGVDLNRSFPDPYTDPSNTAAGREPEVAAIMNLAAGRSFTLAANYHGGALLVNYPFDNNPGGSSVYTASPDDDVFIWISEQYSQHNNPMWTSSGFYHGITNGADWYAISGGMQDWSYHYHGTNEVTIEVSTTKSPPPSQMPTYWSQNRESMLSYLETVLIGVRGIVTDAYSGAPIAATVRVTGRDHDVFTDPDVGDYHRMLLPGVYELTFEGEAYEPVTVSGVSVSSGDATRVDVALWQTRVIQPGGDVLPVGQQTMIRWSGNPSRQFQVQYTENADQISSVQDGFESGSLDPAYSTGGHAGWSVTGSDQYAGTYAGRAGGITHSQVTWMSRAVTAESLRFWYKVSSESGWDFFNFYIDGSRKLHVSGSGGWTEYFTTLTPGSHTLQWEYTKDGSMSSGSDTAWIDEVELSTDGTVWMDIVPLTSVGATSVPWTPTLESGNCKVRVRSYDGSGGYGPWVQSRVFAVGEPPPIPTLSEVGVLVLSVLLVVCAAVVLRGRRGILSRGE